MAADPAWCSARTTITLVFLALGTLACTGDRGDDTAGARCDSCALSLQQVGELRNTYGDPGAQDSYLDLESGPDGRVYAVYNGQNSQVFVHDSTGAVAQVIGREGRGPSEFQNLFVLYASADTLFTFDGPGSRISFFSHAGQYLGATALVHPVSDAIPIAHGRFVVNANMRTPPATGFPLHILGSDGTVALSFGADAERYGSDQTHLLSRLLQPDGTGGVWAARRHEYRLERWSESGDKLRDLRRAVDWFPATERYPAVHPDTAPPAQLTFFQVRPEGIWALIRVPDQRWAEGIEEGTSESGRTVYRVTDPDKVFDSVIELLDPTTGEVLAAHRDDRAFNRILADGRLVRVTYDADGRVFITLWRMERVAGTR